MMENKLREALKPLYGNLLNNVASFMDGSCVFCMQWGKDFPTQPNTGILFVGRATNGWEPGIGKDLDTMFGDGPNRVFNAGDQMQWMEATGYLRKSPFWRVIKKVSGHFYPDDWKSHIAWSNLCKIAPAGRGNPSPSLYVAQFSDCIKILDAEVKILSPKVIVFFTGAKWCGEFFLDGKADSEYVGTEPWGKYECKVYKLKDVICLVTEHPQGKVESAHSECLIKIISKYV